MGTKTNVNFSGLCTISLTKGWFEWILRLYSNSNIVILTPASIRCEWFMLSSLIFDFPISLVHYVYAINSFSFRMCENEGLAGENCVTTAPVISIPKKTKVNRKMKKTMATETILIKIMSRLQSKRRTNFLFFSRSFYDVSCDSDLDSTSRCHWF